MNSAVLLVLGVGLAVPGSLNAGVDTAWVRRYDGPAHGHDWATALAVDSSGNVYVTGASAADTGYVNLDFLTIKYNRSGDTAWMRRLDFSGNDKPYGLGVDARGNVYVAGAGYDQGRLVVAKYDSLGHQLWARSFGSEGSASDLVLDAQGNVLVCGILQGAMATLKVRPNGESAWARTYSSPEGDDHGMALAVDASGKVTVTGYGAGSGTHYDCTTVRYDSTGEQLWAARYDGPNHGDDRAYDIGVDSSGNAAIIGHTDKGYTTPPDYLTVKYASPGETLWARTYDGTAEGWDDGVALALSRDGNVFVTGRSLGQSTNDDYATVKYDQVGTQAWLARYDGPAHTLDQAFAIDLDDLGNAYVTGASRVAQSVQGCVTIKYDIDGDTIWVATYLAPSPSTWSFATEIATGPDGSVHVAGESEGVGFHNSDFVTVKYAQNGGVTCEGTASVAPRPSLFAEPSVFASGTVLSLCINKAAAAQVAVYDAEGRRVRSLLRGSRLVGTTMVTWDGRDERGMQLPSGVYLVVLEAGQQRAKVKVIMSE
jgi:hypothetical protein